MREKKHVATAACIRGTVPTTAGQAYPLSTHHVRGLTCSCDWRCPPHGPSRLQATGTDIAIDAAQIVLMNSNLDAVATSIAISKTTFRRIQINLIFAFGA